MNLDIYNLTKYQQRLFFKKHEDYKYREYKIIPINYMTNS